MFWVPGIGSLPQALDPMMILTELVAAALVVHDWRGGKVYPPYVVTLGFLVVMHAFMWPVQEMAWWHGFTGWFAGTG